MQFFLDQIWIPLVGAALLYAIAKSLKVGG